MKLDKNGFMMAEVIVVSAIILTFLAGIFISYNKIYKVYMTRLSYYDTAALYRLDLYRDYYADAWVTKKSEAVSNKFTELAYIDNNRYNEKVFLIYNNESNLSANVLGNTKIHPTYKDYISYMVDAVDLTNSDYVLIIERCNKLDEDDCRYAYLEVPDET